MCVLCISNSINAQITVENSTPEDNKIEYVYYTDGSSNFDFARLWYDSKNPDMQIDYCKAFIGQKILCIKPGDAYFTYQIKDVEGGEFMLDLAPGGKQSIEKFPVHKIATNCIIQPQISKTDNNSDWWDRWSEAFRDENGIRIGDYMINSRCYIPNNNYNVDESSKFFSQFFLIKGAYTYAEVARMIQESRDKLLSGKVYFPVIQKQISKLEKKKQKGKRLKPNELKMYQELIKSDKYYKIQLNEKEYYSKGLKGDTLIFESPLSGGIYLLVEDNKGQEYFITFKDGSGCITEKHFNRIKEQYVSQYVVETYDGEVVGTTMKCEDIVLRDQALQAKLKDVKTGEISYVPLSYMWSSVSYNVLEYPREENGAYFYLRNYEVIVPEGL